MLPWNGVRKFTSVNLSGFRMQLHRVSPTPRYAIAILMVLLLTGAGIADADDQRIGRYRTEWAEPWKWYWTVMRPGWPVLSDELVDTIMMWLDLNWPLCEPVTVSHDH